ALKNPRLRCSCSRELCWNRPSERGYAPRRLRRERPSESTSSATIPPPRAFADAAARHEQPPPASPLPPAAGFSPASSAGTSPPSLPTTMPASLSVVQVALCVGRVCAQLVGEAQLGSGSSPGLPTAAPMSPRFG